MPHPTPPLTPDQWLLHLFSSKAARTGGVVRRAIRNIDQFYGREAFLAEIDRRGYHVVENSDQWVIFCNQEPVRFPHDDVF
ncbi:MAG: N-(5'-phosphoribosyl)anthranilate isomerase [Thalassovita sp.]